MRALACGLAATFVLLASATNPGFAATVYRCGADGRTFSQMPCPAGEGRVVDVTDERDAHQRGEARDAARRTGAAADSMAAARERLDAQRVRAPGIIPVTRTTSDDVEGDERKPRKTSKKKKRGEEDSGLTVPFKGAPADGSATKRSASSR